MPTATITAKYVNPAAAGKKQGTVKTPDNQIYGVWADKVSQFQAGTIYEIEYDERTSQDGRTFRTITKWNEKGKAPTGYNGPRRSGNTYRETSARDAERMFVCSLLNAAISAGKIELVQSELIPAVEALRDVWDATFGADAQAQEAKH